MKPILIIDAGHGGRDPGAAANGIIEKDYTLKISLYQYERFKVLGVPIEITRDSDVFIDSTPRANIVKNSGAKYCISNHINAAENPSARGVETIHSIFSDGKLAHALFRSIVAQGMPGRRVFCRQGLNSKDYYFMHRETGAVETIIVEYGFATNPQDAELIKTNWQQYAESVVQAICLFIGHRYTVPQTHNRLDGVSEWAKEAWEWAVREGITDGTRPKEVATREEIITMLHRAKGV